MIKNTNYRLYLQALRLADNHDFNELIKFANS